MPAHLTTADVKRLGKSARAAVGALSSIDTWRQPWLGRLSGFRLKPEERLQITTMDWLRENLRPGFVAIHFPTASRSPASWTMMMALGHINGWPDIQIVGEFADPSWRTTAIAFVELKAQTKMTDAQHAFREWAQAHGFPWICARTIEEVQDFCREWRLVP